ncbi:hypothetical protein GGS24DRAFT_448232 [Hypoxylon argillaceum]|nr:hypothetical protein GGS24DRAFT_448232 [Hypoxylon argillaceum]
MYLPTSTVLFFFFFFSKHHHSLINQEAVWRREISVKSLPQSVRASWPRVSDAFHVASTSQSSLMFQSTLVS